VTLEITGSAVFQFEFRPRVDFGPSTLGPADSNQTSHMATGWRCADGRKYQPRGGDGGRGQVGGNGWAEMGGPALTVRFGSQATDHTPALTTRLSALSTSMPQTATRASGHCMAGQGAVFQPTHRDADHARTAYGAGDCRHALCPMSADPVGTIPVRWDPNPTGTNGRRCIDDRRCHGNDRRSNTDDDTWPPTAAAPAIMPSAMPAPARTRPPRRRRRRRQRGH